MKRAHAPGTGYGRARCPFGAGVNENLKQVVFVDADDSELNTAQPAVFAAVPKPLN